MAQALPVQASDSPHGGTARSFAIRRLHPPETALLSDHLKRLDPETRRLRFGNPVNDAFLDSYGARALGDDSIVMGCFLKGSLRGVAELRFLTANRTDAEAAFSLERDFQGEGLGEKLFERLIAAARNRGVKRLFLTCLRENRRMQKIAHHHGAELSFAEGDVTAEIRRPYPDAESLRREWMGEGKAFVFALLEWRRRRLGFLAWPIRRLAAALGRRAPVSKRSAPASRT